MSVELKDLAVNYAKTFEEFKAYVDRKDNEVKKYGESLSDTKTSIDKINAKLEQVEIKLNRPAVDFERRDYNPTSEAKKVFSKLARGKSLTPDEQKNLYVSSDTQGGYLVPDEMAKEIILKATEFSPMRELSKVVSFGSDAVLFPKRSSNIAAAWVAETGSRSADTTTVFGQVRIPAYETYVRLPVSNQMLEDSQFDVESFLNSWASEAFALAEGTAFVTGNGSGKPTGFTTDAGITTLASGSNGSFDGDDLIALTQQLKQSDLNNSTWLFNRSLANTIRQLKSGSQYLWVDVVQNITNGMPLTLCGRPWRISPDMADAATSSKSIALGNFKQGYVVADRVGMSFLRDPYSDAANGNTVMIFRKRVGGAVVDGSAIAVLTLNT